MSAKRILPIVFENEPSPAAVRNHRMTQIEIAVALAFGVSRHRILRRRGPNDDGKWAKFTACFLSSRLTDATWLEIAVHFGVTDHGSALYAAARCRERMEIEPEFCAKVEGLEQVLSGQILLPMEGIVLKGNKLPEGAPRQRQRPRNA